MYAHADRWTFKKKKNIWAGYAENQKGKQKAHWYSQEEFCQVSDIRVGLWGLDLHHWIFDIKVSHLI